MTTVHHDAYDHDLEHESNRILTFFGILFANLGSFGALYFWLMGAIHLWSGNGGQITYLDLDGIALILFWFFPLVVIVSLAAWLLYLARLDLLALGLAAAPLGVMVIYYLWVVLVRVV